MLWLICKDPMWVRSGAKLDAATKAALTEAQRRSMRKNMLNGMRLDGVMQTGQGLCLIMSERPIHIRSAK